MPAVRCRSADGRRGKGEKRLGDVRRTCWPLLGPIAPLRPPLPPPACCEASSSARAANSGLADRNASICSLLNSSVTSIVALLVGTNDGASAEVGCCCCWPFDMDGDRAGAKQERCWRGGGGGRKGRDERSEGVEAGWSAAGDGREGGKGGGVRAGPRREETLGGRQQAEVATACGAKSAGEAAAAPCERSGLDRGGRVGVWVAGWVCRTRACDVLVRRGACVWGEGRAGRREKLRASWPRARPNPRMHFSAGRKPASF